MKYMKYLVFSLVFMILSGIVAVAFLPGHTFEEPSLVLDRFAHGFGYAIPMLLQGCVGLLYKANRFAGFVVMSFVFGIIIPGSTYLV